MILNQNALPPRTPTRREAARGKNLLIVCCGVDLSKISIFRELKETLRVNMYVLEEPNNRMAMQLAEEGVWKHIEVSSFTKFHPTDPLYMEDIMHQLELASKKHNIGQFDGCLTIWDDAVVLCAKIADRLGLPGNSVESVDIAHDKFLSRRRLEQLGLPCPRNVLITKQDAESDERIKELTSHLNLPVIVKPGSGGSSIGVRKVENAQEIVAEYRVCLNVIEHALADGELMGINMGEGAATDILIEEFLEGPEVDVDVVVHDGQIVYSQVMDDWPSRKPWFCELGCHFPTKHTPEKRAQFIAAAQQVVKAIGLTSSVHHLEFIDDKSKGPTLVEANPRMGGGPVYNFHKGAFGMDLMEEVVMSSLGLTHLERHEPYPKEGPEHAHASCVTMVCHARQSGVIHSDVDTALQLARDDPDVALAAVMSHKGDVVVGWDDGFPTDMARIDVVSSTLTIDECIEKCDRLMDDFFSKLEYGNN